MGIIYCNDLGQVYYFFNVVIYDTIELFGNSYHRLLKDDVNKILYCLKVIFPNHKYYSIIH